MRVKGAWVALLSAALLATACGGGGAPEIDAPTLTASTGDAVAAAVEQTVAAIAVAQTVAALVETDEPPPAQATPTAAVTAADLPPTPEVLPTSTPPAPENTPGQCTVVSGVNLRSGPGTAYDPPLAGLGVNAVLTPLAFSPTGFPLGQWVQVQVQGTGQIGWISAGPQWIRCDVDLLTLPPPAVIPPTPQPPPTLAPPPTATRPLAQVPPEIDDEPPGGSFPTDHVRATVVVDPTFLFRMDVRDLNVGEHEGAGVEFVDFSITGDGVDYSRREQTAGFCVFGGGEPICNPWPTDELGRFVWGEGGPLVQNGEFFASITVTSEEEDPEFGTTWNWNFPFRVTLP